MIALDVEVEDERWAELGHSAGGLAEAARAALAVLPETPAGPLAATLLLADDAAVRALNRGWRNQDKPTNVLSFPAPAGAAAPGAPRLLGDIVLAYETVLREAGQEGKTLADHASHLVIHGVLHLLGHDHDADEEADAMERLEVLALDRLGIADPYRSQA